MDTQVVEMSAAGKAAWIPMISTDSYWQEAERADCTLSGITPCLVANTGIDRHTLHKDAARTDCALTYVIEGEYLYTDADGSRFACSRGDMSFLPRGSVYTHVNQPQSRMYAVYFSLRTPDGAYFQPQSTSIRKLTCHDTAKFERLFAKIADSYYNVARSASEVKAALHRLIGALAREETSARLDESECARIAPAVGLLGSGSFAPEAVTVAGLARMCALSEYSFRELFKKYSGMTPKAYIDLRRVEQVEALLASTDVSITDAALTCGFDDPSYFFKMYKRLRGRTPSNR